MCSLGKPRERTWVYKAIDKASLRFCRWQAVAAPKSGETKLKILEMLFGCWHKRLSFPISSKRGQRWSVASRQTGTYVVCLDCGKEFAYDWQQMRIVSVHDDVKTAAASLEAKAS